MTITSIFHTSAISEAVSAQTQTDMENGRVNPTIAELFAALFAGLGLSLTQKGKKGASPRGAADALRALVEGDAPAKKAIPAGILAPKQGWAEVAQALHAYVTALSSVGACDKPEALPSWADPVAIATSKIERANKSAATRAANKANKAEAEAEAEAEAPAPAPALTPASAASFLLAALGADMDCLPDVLGLKLYQTLTSRYAGREVEKSSTVEVSMH